MKIKILKMAPRLAKFDETIFVKPNHWGKIFMYNNQAWNILFPVVDIIRILPKETIITFKHAKNQGNIRLYGSQYNHSVIGVDIKKKQDYISELKKVQFIFIYSDQEDIFATNLIEYCKKTKTHYICYSNLDSVYHIFENGNGTSLQIKDPSEVIKKMEELKEKVLLDKLDYLFPEFEILEDPVSNERSSLDTCIGILKNSQEKEASKKVYSTKLPFDPNFNKVKRLEHTKKKVVYDDEIPVRKSISHLFKKV
jgi:hypothetical protein